MNLDADDIERIADAVAARLEPPAGHFVDAAHVAQTLGVERDWVYANAKRLGAIRIGGPKGRLRFDLAAVRKALAPEAQPAKKSKPRSRPSATGSRVELIPYDQLK